MWVRIELATGEQWIAIPGILYDETDNIIDSASDFAAYLDYLGLTQVDHIDWRNWCTQDMESYSRTPFPPYWTGTDFAIFAGMGLLVHTTADAILPLKFGQGYVKHLVCTDAGIDYYCEWSGQEGFDKL